MDKKKNKLKVFWKLFIIWTACLLISFVVSIILANKINKNQELLGCCLFSEYKKTMTYINAYEQSQMDALYYPSNREKIGKKYNIEYAFSSLDFYGKEKEQAEKWNSCFFYISIPSFLVGFIFFLCTLLYIIYKLIRKTLTNKREILIRLFAVGIPLGLVTLIVSTGIPENSHYKEHEKYSQIDESYNTCFSKLIRLSNEIYKINETYDHRSNLLIQLEYINKKVNSFIIELKEVPAKDIANPAIEICDGTLRFTDLYMLGKDSTEQERNQAKAIAELRVILEKLQNYIFRTLRDGGAFPKDTLQMFDSKAVEQYKRVQIESPEEYNMFIYFGYLLYNAVDKTLEKDF